MDLCTYPPMQIIANLIRGVIPTLNQPDRGSVGGRHRMRRRAMQSDSEKPSDQ